MDLDISGIRNHLKIRRGLIQAKIESHLGFGFEEDSDGIAKIQRTILEGHLQAIDDALERLEKNKYGRCVTCGMEIQKGLAV